MVSLGCSSFVLFFLSLQLFQEPVQKPAERKRPFILQRDTASRRCFSFASA